MGSNLPQLATGRIHSGLVKFAPHLLLREGGQVYPKTSFYTILLQEQVLSTSLVYDLHGTTIGSLEMPRQPDQDMQIPPKR